MRTLQLNINNIKSEKKYFFITANKKLNILILPSIAKE